MKSKMKETVSTIRNLSSFRQVHWLILKKISHLSFASFAFGFICSFVAWNTTSMLCWKNANASWASEPDHRQIGQCMLPLRSAQSTPPNARWVPNARVLISQSRSASAFRSQLYRKKVGDEAVSLSLCFEHCYNQKQHISRAYCFGPDQLRSKSQHAATCQNHSRGFTSQITLDPFSFCKFRGSAMGYRISIFRHFKNS